MTDHHQLDTEDLFAAVVKLPPDERTRILDERCVNVPSLRQEVESLLAHHDRAGSFLNEPPGSAGFAQFVNSHAPARHQTLPAGFRLGGYTLKHVIGEGGMGVVYLAEQDNPRRKVALKLLKSGADSQELRRRFAHEAQVLGWLQHPNIARIYEASTAATEQGVRPFFAMELVDGTSLTDYVTRVCPDTRWRLECVAAIADAVHSAHQKGVIHRDLKPGNILIDAHGQPKVVDFGVARVTDADIRTATMATEAGKLIGTLAYMSPEQIAGRTSGLDSRSDVYALGVILYELLAGRTPHDVSGQSIATAARLIEETAPPRLGAVHARFRGDVETIVQKALEKDKARRYQSAAELAADLRRYLEDEPIQARPATAMYQLRKFVKRNRLLATTSLVFVLALIGGLIHVTWERQRAVAAERIARYERAEAERQAAVARAVNDFLNNDLLASAVPKRASDRELTMREVLDTASARLGDKFKDEPLVDAAIRTTLGTAYVRLGRLEKAQQYLEDALKLYQANLDADHTEVVAAMDNLALAFQRRGRLPEAETLFRDALDRKIRALGLEHADTAVSLNNLAALYHAQGKHDDAEALYLQSFEVRRRLFGDEHGATLTVRCNLANLYHDQGRYEEARDAHEQALATKRRHFGDDHVFTVASVNALAGVYRKLNRLDEAEALWLETMQYRRRVYGTRHPETLKTMNNLAVLYKDRGRYADAERLLTGVLEAQREVLGADHAHTLVTAINLADAYCCMQRIDEALSLFEDTIQVARRALPGGHWYLGVFLTKQGGCLADARRFAEAQDALLEAHKICDAALGPAHDRTRRTLSALADLYDAWGKPDKAGELRERIANTGASVQ